jgi:prevent-host-death family protein
MQGNVPMPKTVTSTEAKSRFGELLKWATQNQDKVIVKLYGEPAAVIISYPEYEEMEKLRKREQKRKVLEALDALRQEVRQQNPDLSTEEAYRLAGFSDDVIQETIQTDEELIAAKS